MVTLLSAIDEPALRALLLRDPAETLFLQSVLDDHGVEGRPGGPPVAFYGAVTGGSMESAVFVGAFGRLVVPAGEGTLGFAELGRYLRRRASITTIIGLREAVDAIWEAYSGGGRARISRAQRMLRISADDLGPWTSNALRPAQIEELDDVLVAAALLHREDMGQDPLRTDPEGFRRRVADRIAAGQTFIVREEGQLAFKADVGVRCRAGAQLEGVYTSPPFRRRGLATAAVAQLCRSLLASVPRVTLHVNDDNSAALGLYRKIGFHDGRPYRLLSVE